MNELETAPVEAPAAPVETGLDANQPVSVTIGDIELTGAGETEASLREGLPKDAAAPAPAKPSKGRQRYSDLTSERDQEASKRAEVERERDDLKARLAALESRPSAPAPVAAAVPPSAAPVSPQKFSFPTYDAAVGQNPALTWDDWNDEKIAARARWEYQQAQGDLEARIRSGIEADQASRAFAGSVKTVLDRGQSAYPDFDAMFKQGAGRFIGPTQQSDLERAQLIYRQPNAEHIIYAIAANPQVAPALARMSDVQFGMAIAALAPTSPAASPASTGSAGPFVPPPPMQPVGSGSKTAVPSAVDLAERGGEDYDASGFREQLRRDRGRR